MDCGEKVRMAKQFDDGNADADRLMQYAGDGMVGPSDFHVRRDGDDAIGHAVEERFQLRTALADGGKVFFQTPGSTVKSHGYLGYLVTAGYGNARGKVPGSNLLRTTHDAAQPTRNHLRDRYSQYERQKQGKYRGTEKVGANRGNLLLHAGKRIGQANDLVTTGNGQVKEFNANSVAYARGTAGFPRQRRHDFRPAGMVFHGLGISFRIGKHHAVTGNDGDARLCDARFFLGHLLQRVLVVILNAK